MRVSGVFGLMSSASDAAGRDASPTTRANTKLTASIESSAWRGMKHPENRKTNQYASERDYAKL